MSLYCIGTPHPTHGFARRSPGAGSGLEPDMSEINPRAYREQQYTSTEKFSTRLPRNESNAHSHAVASPNILVFSLQFAPLFERPDGSDAFF